VADITLYPSLKIAGACANGGHDLLSQINGISHKLCTNNQPEVGCKCGQVLALLKEPRNPVKASRKPKRKMAF